VKYVGLLALAKILPTHPKLVSEHKDIILKCIDDPDISIRLRALDLVVGMVRNNLENHLCLYNVYLLIISILKRLTKKIVRTLSNV
jgi:hypothetical protein